MSYQDSQQEADARARRDDEEDEMRARQQDPRRAMIDEIAERRSAGLRAEIEQSEEAERQIAAQVEERALIRSDDAAAMAAFDVEAERIARALENVEERTRQEGVVREAIDMMLDGNTDEAAKLLTETMATVQGRSTTPSTDEVVSAAVGRIKLEQQLANFQKDYSDVASDTHLGRMVDEEFMAIVPKDANGNALPLPPAEFGKKLRQAGDKVRDWVKGKSSAAASLSELAPDDPSSRSSVIAAMACARGRPN